MKSRQDSDIVRKGQIIQDIETELSGRGLQAEFTLEA